jgi:general stress protein 26
MILPVAENSSQEGASAEPGREQLLSAARKIMEAAQFCTLITIDENGQPQARTMDPFAPEDDMVVWLGTSSKSRKVRHIRGKPRVTLFYFDPEGLSYVSLAGKARLVDDEKLEERLWKEDWNSIYTDREETYLLIEVTPETLEIVSVAHGIDGDPVTWAPPVVIFTETNPVAPAQSNFTSE